MKANIPVQNPNLYKNYGIPIPNNPNVVGIPPQIQYSVVNQPQIQNYQQTTGNKRKTYTPGQYQQGKMVFQEPQLIPHQTIQNQPQPHGQKNMRTSHAGFQKQIINPMQRLAQTQIYQPQGYGQQNVQQIQQNLPQNPNMKKTATLMTVNTLANLPYKEYPQAEYSHKPFYNICGYSYNSYNGKVRDYNEDSTKTVVNYPKKIIVNGKTISPRISYFGLFDGHGGEGCTNFLRDNLDYYLFNSKLFPAYPIQAAKEAFINAEKGFMSKAIDQSKKALVDKSGSCALIALIINDTLYAINLGDSRALLSSDSGQNLYQITRDHKPNDPLEKRRIEKSGAKVYYANTVVVEGKEVELKESDYGEGFTFPYRISPGGISVSIILLI